MINQIKEVNNYYIYFILFYFNILLSIFLEITQYQSHLKIISYRIESPIIFNLNKILIQNKSSNSECKSSENNSS